MRILPVIAVFILMLLSWIQRSMIVGRDQKISDLLRVLKVERDYRFSRGKSFDAIVRIFLPLEHIKATLTVLAIQAHEANEAVARACKDTTCSEVSLHVLEEVKEARRQAFEEARACADDVFRLDFSKHLIDFVPEELRHRKG